MLSNTQKGGQALDGEGSNLVSHSFFSVGVGGFRKDLEKSTFIL